MTQQNTEMTVREATLVAIGKSAEGLKEIKDIFLEAASAFDTGKDREGLQVIEGTLIPRLSAFYQFCVAIKDSHADVIGPELAERLGVKFKQLEAVMDSLAKETEAGNFTEVGDILRFDFHDLLSEMSAIFPELARKFSESSDKSLDKT